MGLSRRDLMKKAGMAAVGTGLAGISLAMASQAIGAGEQQNKIPDLPWPYKKLDRKPPRNWHTRDTTRGPAAMGYSNRL